MYAHERSLVKRMAGKPFALIGVNSDSKETVRKAIKEEDLTWRSFWDGGDTRGPIATKWAVTGWPTIYILDAKGVIRFKNRRGEAMDAAIEELLAEMKGEE
jgi:hypothetical protein